MTIIVSCIPKTPWNNIYSHVTIFYWQYSTSPSFCGRLVILASKIFQLKKKKNRYRWRLVNNKVQLMKLVTKNGLKQNLCTKKQPFILSLCRESDKSVRQWMQHSIMLFHHSHRLLYNSWEHYKPNRMFSFNTHTNAQVNGKSQHLRNKHNTNGPVTSCYNNANVLYHSGWLM